MRAAIVKPSKMVCIRQFSRQTPNEGNLRADGIFELIFPSWTSKLNGSEKRNAEGGIQKTAWMNVGRRKT